MIVFPGTTHTHLSDTIGHYNKRQKTKPSIVWTKTRFWTIEYRSMHPHMFTQHIKYALW